MKNYITPDLEFLSLSRDVLTSSLNFVDGNAAYDENTYDLGDVFWN